VIALIVFGLNKHRRPENKDEKREERRIKCTYQNERWKGKRKGIACEKTRRGKERGNEE
jgi:hypothetical protein